jgi:hypothetical protein
MKPHSVDAIVQRVRGEYLEMPGLSLTERQAERLWHLEPEVCHSLFKALVDSGFLRQTPRGGYVRATVG